MSIGPRESVVSRVIVFFFVNSKVSEVRKILDTVVASRLYIKSNIYCYSVKELLKNKCT